MSSKLLLPTQPALLISRNQPFIHRDLSWLQFNDRVLAEARLATNPTLERLKFLAITSSNLDEFFMIRVASLQRKIARMQKAGTERERLLTIWANIHATVSRFVVRQGDTLSTLSHELAAQNIFLVRKSKPDEPSFEIGRKIFLEQIAPQLSAPEEFQPSKIVGLENLQMAVSVGREAWIPLPKSIPSVHVAIDEWLNHVFVFFLDTLLSAHLAPALQLKQKPGFVRLTRDGDFTLEFDQEDSSAIPDLIRSNLRSREKGKPVRLQYAGDLPADLLHKMVHNLRLQDIQVFPSPHHLGLRGLWNVYNHPRVAVGAREPGLCYPVFQAKPPRKFGSKKIFEILNEEDLLLHHPYDSFDAFVEWIKAACNDTKVTMIEQTIYRMDALSPIIPALKSAAATKKIRVVIELRARFDEFNNLQLADELKRAGVEVSFGFGKLKLHAKIALVTRIDGDQTIRYTHLSTGNYHSATARAYTDLALLTSHSEIGADARKFFDAVFEKQIPSGFRQLESAPSRLHRRLLSLIQAETEAAKAGRKARIVAKVNALVDETVIQKLYEASASGVQVDLIVRGACSLIPGVKGLSENIRVISLVGRYLEHSRIYWFLDSQKMYLSSADWMPRNFFSRLEIAYPVLNERIYRYLAEVLIPAYFLDTEKVRELTPQGIWRKRSSSSLRAEEKNSLAAALNSQHFGAQRFFEHLAQEKYKGSPIE